jgi:uncharacterized protein YndB with AHSA1/START domain
MTTQIHRIFIKATPEAVWDAITDPKWNSQYGYGSPGEYELRPGGAYRALATQAMREHGAAEVIIDGEVLECDPPRKLVQTWRALFDERTIAEGFTRLTWEIEETYGVTRLTVTHELENAPVVAEQTSGNASDAGGGWPHVLSDLKTLLETGTNMAS